MLSIARVAWGNEALWWLDGEQATLLTEKNLNCVMFYF